MLPRSLCGRTRRASTRRKTPDCRSGCHAHLQRLTGVLIYLAGSADGLKGQGDNKGNPSAQGNPVLATSLANVPGTVDLLVAGKGSYLRFRGTNAQGDVAKTLTDVMAVAELGVRVGRSN